MAIGAPTPPGIQTHGADKEEGELETRLLGLFEGMGSEERRRSMEEAVKILQNILQPPPPPAVSVEDPQNEVPQGAFKPFLIPCAGDRRFTLPFPKDPMAVRRIYNRRWSVLPSRAANIPCSGMKPETLLRWLNTIFEKRFAPSDGVKASLLRFIDDGCDVGQVYGYLRPWMENAPDGNAFSKIPDRISECREKDFELRSNAINSNRIVDPKVPPRRVWDLYANRVLPFYAISSLSPGHTCATMPQKLWAVSHSWLPSSDRQSVLTMVNGKAWRVSIPRNTTLEEIRNELLILGAEYVFLDVLCLRQKDELLPEFESIRKREWRLDVPTIGHAYSGYDRTVVVYFNGLGLPFHDGGANHGDRFHWFNRAWTLQECPTRIIPGGLKHKINAFDVTNSNASWASEDFSHHLRSMMRTGDITSRDESQFGQYVKEIQSRYCSNPVDQVACLAYLLRCPTLPIYDADMDVEVAWSLLVECLPDWIRTDLLLSDFSRGGRSTSWRPTWEQVASCRAFRSMSLLGSRDLLQHLDGSSPDAEFRYGLDAYYSKSYIIENCLVSIPEPEDQTAGAHVLVPCTCAATPHRHQFRISEWDRPITPDITYLLIKIGWYWLLARLEGVRRINNERAIEVSKVAVLDIPHTFIGSTLGVGIQSHERLVVYR